jgi:transposase-like protein
MFRLVEQHLESEESERSFCARHGVTRSVLVYWKAKYRRETPPGGAFIEVRPPVTPAGASVEVLSPGGVRMTFFGAVDAATLVVLGTERAA